MKGAYVWYMYKDVLDEVRASEDGNVEICWKRSNTEDGTHR